MRIEMARRGSLVAIAAALALLVAPGFAAAETFEGETVQGKPVSIETRPDGTLRQATWRWRTSKCNEPGIQLRTQFTRLRNPKRSRPGFFTAKGTYKVRFSDSKVRFEVGGIGRQRTPERWSGSFRAKAFVNLDDGSRVKCKLRRIEWAAKL